MEQKPCWMSFQDWLNINSMPSSSETEEDAAVSQRSEPMNPASEPAPSTSEVTQPAPRATQPEPTTSSAPRAPPSTTLARDCRTETRLVDGSARARQEMTIMLSVPGVPLHKAPMVTAKQAAALMAALCEPLIQIRVGRLTRRMEAPTKLSPTGEVGILSLWLLPNDDLSLVWQARETNASEDGEEADVIKDTSPSSSGAAADMDVTLWEELVRFPAGVLPRVDDPLVIIHMLRGDTTGRSFYIRPREDVMASFTAANMPAVASTGEDDVKTDDVVASLQSTASAARMYFWVAEQNLAGGIHNLGRLKSLLKRPPTLARRSGLTEAQLSHISGWLQALEVGPATHRVPSSDASSKLDERPATDGITSNSAMPRSSSPRPSGVSAAFKDFQAEPAGARLARLSSPTVVRSNRAAASSTVCATAAALYQDPRFNVAYPCIISVAVSLSLHAQLGEEVDQGMSEEACTKAKAVAETAARNAVDRAGRQRIEERICESFICSMKAQRAKAKAEKQQRKEAEQRAQNLLQHAPMIKQAVQHAAAIVGGTTPPPSLAGPSRYAPEARDVETPMSASVSEQRDSTATPSERVSGEVPSLSEAQSRHRGVTINDLNSLLNKAASVAPGDIDAASTASGSGNKEVPVAERELEK